MKTEFWAKNCDAWHHWLTEHHQTQTEIWLVFFKKHTGKQVMTYREALEEALCFGWIDGLKRRLDDKRYAYRFSPRKARSHWSALNIRLATELSAAGRMTEAGTKAFAAGIPLDPDHAAQKSPVLPPEIVHELKQHPQAWSYFRALSPGYRKQYVRWLMDAKKTETRQRRLKEAIELLGQNKKLGMK